jgi:hypothetical protein
MRYATENAAHALRFTLREVRSSCRALATTAPAPALWFTLLAVLIPYYTPCCVHNTSPPGSHAEPRYAL